MKYQRTIVAVVSSFSLMIWTFCYLEVFREQSHVLLSVNAVISAEEGRPAVSIRNANQETKLFQYKALSDRNITYLIDNRDICTKRKKVELLIFAFTRTGDFHQRQHIRNTWGQKAVLKQLRAVLVFPVGLSDKDDINRQHVAAENARQGDLVLGNFEDTYRNLSYKAVMMLRWTSAHCSSAKFLLKVDADVFVNTFALVSLLRSSYR